MRFLAPKGAIGVTTPSELATEDFYRIKRMLELYKVPLLYTIVNMTTMTCPHCHEAIDVFGSSKVTSESDIFEVPLNPEIAQTRYIPGFEEVASKVIQKVEVVAK